MKILVVFVAIFVVLAGIFFFSKTGTKTPLEVPSPSPSPSTRKETVDINASFTIITGSITRSFNAEKYHNQSPDVYIESVDPTIVNVKKIGTTWNDFFKTLPMTLTKDCLITGDGETLCNEKGGTLKFYLNNIQTPDLLDKEIRDRDKVLIKFTSY